MRRRLALLALTVAAAAAAATPAAGTDRGSDIILPYSTPPGICVWSDGTYVGGVYVPLEVPYTCTPPVFG